MNANALNYNRYSYCLNNPLRYTDPSGYRFSSVEWFNTSLEDYFLNFTLDIDMGYYLYEEDGGGGCSSSNTSSQTDWVTGNTFTSTADMVSHAWENAPEGGTMSFFYTDGELDCFSTGFALPCAMVYGQWHMGIWRTSRVQFPDGWGVVNFGDAMDGDGYITGASGLTVAGGTNDGIGGFGTGMTKLNGSFRIYKGGYISPKYYPSNWKGGSRAQITTYSVAEWGNRISRGSFLVSLGLGAIDINQAYNLDGETLGYNTQVATAQTAGDILGSLAGAKIGAAIGGLFGGVGAIPRVVIGGFVGGILGGWGGSGLGGAIVGWFH